GYDVVFSDHASGTEWVAQLKATSSEAYVEEWLEQHPDGEIIITSELAERMGLQDSGFANAELTADTEELVDQLISAEQNDAIWEYIPGLTALSIAAVVYEMHRRLLRGEISRDEFIWMTAKATGKSAARVLVLTSLLSIPFISFITALALIANILSQTSFIGRVNAYIERKRAVIDAVKKFQLAAHSEKLIIEGALKSAHLQREIIASLEGKSEEATNIYWKEYRRTLAGLDERGSTRDKIRLSYNDPSEYIPPEHHDGQVEDSIRAKINELEGGRLQLFAKARVAMNDAGLSASFIGFIKDTLDKQQAEALIFKINGDSEYIKRP
ncbi:hypothetical protein, partial [Erythrobacter sp. HI0063]|uniref:hypothetical protein n=1 Tax=Erythrobacter sp. HI0063 TaxID=1822240 RepID=UPI000A986860